METENHQINISKRGSKGWLDVQAIVHMSVDKNVWEFSGFMTIIETIWQGNSTLLSMNYPLTK